MVPFGVVVGAGALAMVWVEAAKIVAAVAAAASARVMKAAAANTKSE
jgi:hypothetical protein